MIRAFAYTTMQNEPRIGVFYENKNYDFTRIWHIFKEIKNSPRTPDYHFIQIMIEMENFSKEVFLEVITEVKEFRGLEDCVIQKDFNYDVPIQRPSKILCLGKNYAKHAAEFNSDIPEKPMFFSKLPSTLLPHEGMIKIPADIGRVDHEVELALVIGKIAYHVSEMHAMDYVAGYMIANDVSARALQGEAKKAGHPWTLAKGIDTFLPCGPFLVPADAVDDPHDLDMALTVNGEVRQNSNTGNMVFQIPKIIAYITKYITLHPGDVICTGTPEGCTPLKSGDLVQCKIKGLGVLRNEVVFN